MLPLVAGTGLPVALSLLEATVGVVTLLGRLAATTPLLVMAVAMSRLQLPATVSVPPHAAAVGEAEEVVNLTIVAVVAVVEDVIDHPHLGVPCPQPTSTLLPAAVVAAAVVMAAVTTIPRLDAVAMRMIHMQEPTEAGLEGITMNPIEGVR